VRLTVGGEPTFISIDDMEGPEWNYAALSDAKLALANELLLRLRARFAPGGLLHYGQGKWYPGEPLPRWALSVIWRTDGQPLWEQENEPRDDVAYTFEDARRFAHELAQFLGLSTEYVQPAFEPIPVGVLPEPIHAPPIEGSNKPSPEHDPVRPLTHAPTLP